MGTMGDDLTAFGRSAFEETDHRRGSAGGGQKRKSKSLSHGKKSKKFKKRKF
jgi:hypothetical protein